MTLSDNGFAVLGVSPTDNRKTLAEKADHLVLLGVKDAEAAFDQLTQTSCRIASELSWFPGATKEAANAFLDYARNITEGNPAIIPSMDGLGTAIAQANALDALFNVLPADEPELFIGLCRTIEGILSEVEAEEVLLALNSDRQAGDWETIQSVQEIEEPLDTHLRELCGPAVRAAEKMETGVLANTLCQLFKVQDFNAQGYVAQGIASVYNDRINKKNETLKNRLIAISTKTMSKQSISEADINELKKMADEWCPLSLPLRYTYESVRNDARTIGFALRNIVVDFVNKAPKVQKEKRFTIYNVISDNQRVTITYYSKRETVNKALEYITWMENSFPEQSELINLLLNDKVQLNMIIINEDNMLKDAENKARGNKLL